MTYRINRKASEVIFPCDLIQKSQLPLTKLIGHAKLKSGETTSNGGNMRTVSWNENERAVEMIDQRLLPGEFKLVRYTHYQQIINAIRDMVVRGAPAIGASAAYGMALAAVNITTDSPSLFKQELKTAGQELAESRPTAVNLVWAIHRIMKKVDQSQGDVGELRSLVISEAQCIADEDVEINLRMARYGADLLQDGDTVIHHCNTGALATVDWGTALGVIRMAHEQGKKIHVLVDETRPRLQGARLTAWELQQYGIPFDIISDNAAGYFLAKGEVQKVLFGADRVAANGDVANKIGTYMLALSAHTNHVPVYAVVPMSTVDLTLKHGGLIPIEERSMDEVLQLEINLKPVFPQGARARNPAFDITPNNLITAIVTEKGLVYPPFDTNLSRLF